MKRLAPLLFLLLAVPALAAEKPLAPGVYTVKGCPECPPGVTRDDGTPCRVGDVHIIQTTGNAFRSVCAPPPAATPCPICAECPAQASVPVQPRPGGMRALSHRMVHSDIPAAGADLVAAPAAPSRRLTTWGAVWRSSLVAIGVNILRNSLGPGHGDDPKDARHPACGPDCGDR